MDDQNTNTTGATAPEPAAAVPPNTPGVENAAPAAGVQTPEETQTVPVHVLQAVRDEAKAAKDEVALYKTQLEEARAARAQGPAQPQTFQGPTATDPFAGMRGDDLLTVDHVKAVIGTIVGQALGPVMQEIQGLKLAPEKQAIEAHLVPVLKTNPALAQALLSGNIGQVVVQLAKVFAGNPPGGGNGNGNGLPAPKESALASIERILANAAKPGSASAAGGGLPASGAARFANMTDEQLEAEIKKAKGG